MMPKKKRTDPNPGNVRLFSTPRVLRQEFGDRYKVLSDIIDSPEMAFLDGLFRGNAQQQNEAIDYAVTLPDYNNARAALAKLAEEVALEQLHRIEQEVAQDMIKQGLSLPPPLKPSLKDDPLLGGMQEKPKPAPFGFSSAVDHRLSGEITELG